VTARRRLIVALKSMGQWATILLTLALTSIPGADPAIAQADVKKLTVKNGESVELGAVVWTVNCQSTMVGLPEVEVLEGPPGIALTIREERVLSVRNNCPAKFPGGTLMLAVTGVTQPIEAKLTYRLKYKTLDGPRQRANTFILSLQP
jgi:hypothetical protein